MAQFCTVADTVTSQLPKNWGSTKKRVDVAIKGRASQSVFDTLKVDHLEGVRSSKS